MSEYQYYEFQAIDRPLTQEEMASLRALSSRATITPTRFVNTYSYGDFRGSPEKLMEEYFDAHLYLANWGTHRLMFRLPRRLLDIETAERYCPGEFAMAHAAGDFVILDFVSEEEDGGRWVEDEEGPGWMASLLPLRGDIASGDLRCLYLAWLGAAQNGFVEGALDDVYNEEDVGEDEDDDDDDYDDKENQEDDVGDVDDEEWEEDQNAADVEEREGDHETEAAAGGPVAEAGLGDESSDDQAVEPSVPPGLGQLTAPLEAFVEFMRIDKDLIAVAAERSAPLDEVTASGAEFGHWVAALTDAEKTALLMKVVEGSGFGVQAELIQRYRRSKAPGVGTTGPDAGRRTAAYLIKTATENRIRRRKIEAERRAQERAQEQREAAARREAYLNSLVGREDELWQRVEQLADVKKATEYDEAFRLIRDLRDVAARYGQTAAFGMRLSSFRQRRSRQTALLERLNKLVRHS